MVKKLYLYCAFLFFVSSLLTAHQPFIVVTPEKTGTHLLTKAIERMVKKTTTNYWSHVIPPEQLSEILKQAQDNNAFVHIHALPDPAMIALLKSHSYKVIFLMRDPRDTMVSLLHYIEKDWAYGPFNLKRPYGQLSMKKKLDEIITGRRYGISGVHEIIVRRLDWLNSDPDFVHTVYFENLVGSEGGGSDRRQKNAIKGIAKHIDLEITPSLLKEVTTDLFGGPPGKPGTKNTFRSGQIGSWREEFSRGDIREFKKNFGKLLIELGYEKDLNW